MTRDKKTSQAFYKAPRYLFRKLNILRMFEKISPGGTFLDVGCGAGELACTLAQNGHTGTGLDFSGKALVAAKSIRASRGIDASQLDFKLGGIEKISKATYDMVICCEVLEHIEQDEVFLKQLCGLDANYYIFSVPARQKWFDKFDEKVGHYRRYEKDELKNMIQAAGLEIIEFSAYGYPFINITRLIRKALASRIKKQKTDEDRTKESGINPIKASGRYTKIDLERPLKPLYHFSLMFNKFNLSEGYLVLCRKGK